MTKDELVKAMQDCTKHKGYMVSIPHRTLEEWLDCVIELEDPQQSEELYGCTRWGSKVMEGQR